MIRSGLEIGDLLHEDLLPYGFELGKWLIVRELDEQRDGHEQHEETIGGFEVSEEVLILHFASELIEVLMVFTLLQQITAQDCSNYEQDNCGYELDK